MAAIHGPRQVREQPERSHIANGTLIQLCTCNGTSAQQWRATTSGQLINPQSGLCLDDPS
jgi:hypothetical protein